MSVCLHFPRQKSPSSIRCSSYVLFSSPFISFAAFLWTCLNNSIFILQWVAQNWTQYSRRGLNNTTYRGKTIPLVLLATPFLWVANGILITLAHWWLMFSWLSARTPWSFSARQLLACSSLDPYYCPSCRLFSHSFMSSHLVSQHWW